MESSERAKRVSTAKNKRKKYDEGAKDFNNKPSTCTSVVVDEASARTYAEDNNLIYEADRSTFTKLPRDAAGGPKQHLPVKYASVEVQTVDSTIYKLQHSTDVTDVHYWSRLPQTVAAEFLHIINPQTRRYMRSSDVHKLHDGELELSSVIDKSMLRCAAPRSIKLRDPQAPAPTQRNSDDEQNDFPPEEKRKFYTEILTSNTIFHDVHAHVGKT